MNGRQTIQHCGHVCLSCSLGDGQLCTEEYHDDDDVEEAEECFGWWMAPTVIILGARWMALQSLFYLLD